MLHILLSFLLIAIALIISVRQNGTQRGYLILAWVPLALLLIAAGCESAFGFKRFAEVIYHFAYDTSYILSLAGIMLLLTSVLRRTPKKMLLIGIVISAIPIFALLLSQ